jgi:PAS domain S-box-containing protein
MSDEKLLPVEKPFTANLESLQFALSSANIGTWDVRLVPVMTAVWDDRCREIFGVGESYEMNFTNSLEFIHPDDREMVDKVVQDTLGGANNGNYNVFYRTVTCDGIGPRWVNTIGKAYFNEQGTPLRFAGIAIDATTTMRERQELVQARNARQELVNTRSNYGALVEQAPMAIALLSGPSLIIEAANDTILRIWDKERSVLGKPIAEVITDARGEPFLNKLKHVYETGEGYQRAGVPGILMENGKPVEAYFDAIYAPSKNEKQEIIGVLVLASIVTDRVLSLQKLEETETSLREALEIAELGTWRLNLENSVITYSERMQEWYGLSSPDLPGEDFIMMIDEAYRENALAARRKIDMAGIDGLVTSEHKVINVKTGQARIIQSIGKKILSSQGIPVAITGTSRDVTEQRMRELGLEKEVQVGAEQLAAVNEELQATNEELTATNEELAQINEALQRTNDELAQYAYVASHDLQEPLRKIRTFATFLGDQQELSIDSREYLRKIIYSATRMSSLIKDLLEYSSLLDTRALMRPLDMKEILLAVVEDFELSTREAEIEVSSMPVIEGIRLQMNQLFQNIISNALKFVEPSRKPVIKISSREVAGEELTKLIPNAQSATRYHEISVSDNGIGFDAAYANRIFEVFKRLHGRSVYAGSGIGLAISKRIVDNHNGHIYAHSVQGAGSDFLIILPERQV